MDWWKIYDKIKLPVVIILILILYYLFFFAERTYVVTCSDNTTLELDEYLEYWEKLCPNSPSTPTSIPVESFNTSTSGRTGNSILVDQSFPITDNTFN